MGWDAYAGMFVGGVVAAVLIHLLFGLARSVAGAAFYGALAGVAMCAGVRWTASRGGRWRRASSPRRRP
ncbi:MAG: hypothetical protein M3N45_14895 [Actinomycetota bacterium]|nr:hypothetical protein [Actinomycetota bacterium]